MKIKKLHLAYKILAAGASTGKQTPLPIKVQKERHSTEKQDSHYHNINNNVNSK